MKRFINNKINVVGDSLESCLYSRKLAESPEYDEVIHYITGYLGGVYRDTSSEYLLGLLGDNQVKTISKYIGSDFIEVSENYIKIPQKKLPFQNSYDGYVRFPFTKASFENEFDLNDMFIKKMTYQEFISMYEENRNLNKLFKEILNEEFYLSVVKKIGSNIWNINFSQYDPTFVYKNLLVLDSLDETNVRSLYRPELGITYLCSELLNHPKIRVIKLPRFEIKKITQSIEDMVTVFCEYYDYYFNFIFGTIDYTEPEIFIHKKNNLLIDNYSRIYTPYDNEYGMYYQLENNVFKVKYRDCIINNIDFKPKQIIPSQTNVKKIFEYKKLSNVIRHHKILL